MIDVTPRDLVRLAVVKTVHSFICVTMASVTPEPQRRGQGSRKSNKYPTDARQSGIKRA
jgi:hypothetical protein